MSTEIRSKERVSENGEVFTPDHIVHKMNDLIPIEAWKDPSYIFLEPTAGNGQFLVQIVQKRIYNGLSIEDACNTLFGMDIMKDNIIQCQQRLIKICCGALVKEGLKEGGTDWNERLIRVICILHNNIYKFKDSLKDMSNGDFLKKRFFDYDPTGTGLVLSTSKQEEIKTKVRDKILEGTYGKGAVYA